MMPATTAETSASASRLALTMASKRWTKSGAAAFSSTGIDGLPEFLEPAADLVRPGLERGAVDHQPRRHPGDHFHFDQAVGLERRAGRAQVDDAPAQAQGRRKLHGTVQLERQDT